MNSKTTVYSADRVVVNFLGNIFDGFADGEFITVEMKAADFESKVGSDGEVGIARTNDRRAEIKFKLLQGSTSNAVLTEARREALESPTGGGVGVFELVDLTSGEVLASSRDTFVAHAPSISRAREIIEYEWTLEAAHMNISVNGSPSI